MNNVSLWNWPAGDPVPDARLVVCAPGIMGPPLDMAESIEAAMDEGVSLFVAPDAWSGGICGRRLIPALHASTQADLEGRVCEACREHRPRPEAQDWRVQRQARSVCHEYGRVGGLRALMAVQAERRAVVLSPREALILNGGPCEHHEDHSLVAFPSICLACRATNIIGIDLVIVCAFDEPISADYARSVRDQAQVAGIPFIFLGLDNSERCGLLLDGAYHLDLPTWMGGEG